MVKRRKIKRNEHIHNLNAKGEQINLKTTANTKQAQEKSTEQHSVVGPRSARKFAIPKCNTHQKYARGPAKGS